MQNERCSKNVKNLAPAIQTCLFFLVCGLVPIAGCTTSYFVDPMSTPVFTEPGQAEVQGSITENGKYYFEGAYSLPENIEVLGNFQLWGHGLTNDQQSLSFGLGKFWPLRDSENILSVLGGAGIGFHRSGPNMYFDPNPISQPPGRADQKDKVLPLSSFDTAFMTANNNFRNFYAQFTWAQQISLDDNPKHNLLTGGLASRIEYVDQFHFFQKVIDSLGEPDQLASIDNGPKHLWHLDFAVFLSINMEFLGLDFIQLYGQMMLDLPLNGLQGQTYFEIYPVSAGLRFTF